jgi:hypothetical protein
MYTGRSFNHRILSNGLGWMVIQECQIIQIPAGIIVDVSMLLEFTGYAANGTIIPGLDLISM